MKGNKPKVGDAVRPKDPKLRKEGVWLVEWCSEEVNCYFCSLQFNTPKIHEMFVLDEIESWC